MRFSRLSRSFSRVRFKSLSDTISVSRCAMTHLFNVDRPTPKSDASCFLVARLSAQSASLQNAIRPSVSIPQSVFFAAIYAVKGAASNRGRSIAEATFSIPCYKAERNRKTALRLMRKLRKSQGATAAREENDALQIGMAMSIFRLGSWPGRQPLSSPSQTSHCRRPPPTPRQRRHHLA